MKDSRIQSAVEITENTKQVQAKPGSRFRKGRIWMISIIALLSLSIVSGVLLYNGQFSSLATEDGENPKLYSPGPIYSFGPLIVNIAGTNATRYLRIGVSVECGSQEAHGKLVENEVRIRDRILDLLCVQSIEELLDVSTREHLRAKMAVKIREALGNGKDSSEWIRSVYFSEFTIQ
mgnify:CR=1 FL=1|jgi:flagellar basal body-associated protein FliL